MTVTPNWLNGKYYINIDHQTGRVRHGQILGPLNIDWPYYVCTALPEEKPIRPIVHMIVNVEEIAVQEWWLYEDEDTWKAQWQEIQDAITVQQAQVAIAEAAAVDRTRRRRPAAKASR